MKLMHFELLYKSYMRVSQNAELREEKDKGSAHSAALFNLLGAINTEHWTFVFQIGHYNNNVS